MVSLNFLIFYSDVLDLGSCHLQASCCETYLVDPQVLEALEPLVGLGRQSLESLEVLVSQVGHVAPGHLERKIQQIKSLKGRKHFKI